MKIKFMALFMALAMLLSLLAACSSEMTTTGGEKDPTKKPQMEQSVPATGDPDTDPSTNKPTETTEPMPTEPTSTEPIEPEVKYEIAHIDAFHDGLARFSAYVPNEEYEGYYDTRYGY